MPTRLASHLVVALLVVVAGCGHPKPAAEPVNPPAAPAAPSPREVAAAWAELGRLPIRAEDTGAHYSRAEWGNWYPVGDGCDTRDQILRDQGRDVRVARGCRLTGTWVSPYDQVTVTNPADLQIDHRVPLKEAMRTGARTWTRDQREFFYNNHVNLVAVTAGANTAKGDKDPGRWRPPHRAHWCGYATAYITTKHAWHLTVDQHEHDALAAMVRTCP